MKRWLTQGSSGRRQIDPFYPIQPFLHINGPKKAETDSRGMGLCYIAPPTRLN